MVVKKNNIPYIYKNPNEINIIRTIKKVFLKHKNVIKTVKYLNTKNLKYRNGVDWNNKQIANCLKKYFPNLLFNKNSDLVNNYFEKYEELNDNSIDIDNKTNIGDTSKLENINLNNPSIKPKRKYTKKK